MPANAATDAAGATGAWYSYAIVRVVPRVEREEFLNVGVILFARTLGFLEARIQLDEQRLRALAPAADVATLKRHLDTFQAEARGDAAGGPVAALDASQRFHWLTSPRSTTIQTSPVHMGYCEDPSQALDQLMQELVSAD